MTNVSHGVISFLGYRVKSLLYNCEPSFEFVELDGGAMHFNFQKALIKKDSHTVQVNLIANVFYSTDKDFNSAPFKLSAEIAGRFTCEDEWCEKWETNALAILFPYIRAIISTVSSQIGREPIILPTVNITQMFKPQPVDGELTDEP